MGKESCIMLMILSTQGVFRGISLLVAFATLSFTVDARATLVALYYNATATGGSFVDPNVLDAASHVTYPPDHLSFSVAGDYSVLADGSSSTVNVSIATQLLTTNIQGSFNLNTFIDGFFAYIPTSPPGTTPTITSYSATSDLKDIVGSATVTLPVSPIPLSRAASFPTGGLELTGSASSVVTIPAGFVYRDYLEQTTTLTFDHVTAGETLQIQLPDNTSLNAVPEPGSLTLLGLGGLLTTGAAWRRKRSLDAGRTAASN
jgi:PEP-CTERM motif